MQGVGALSGGRAQAGLCRVDAVSSVVEVRHRVSDLLGQSDALLGSGARRLGVTATGQEGGVVLAHGSPFARRGKATAAFRHLTSHRSASVSNAGAHGMREGSGLGGGNRVVVATCLPQRAALPCTNRVGGAVAGPGNRVHAHGATQEETTTSHTVMSRRKAWEAVVTKGQAGTVPSVTNPDESSWQNLTQSIAPTATASEILARRRRVWRSYHEAESVSAWLTEELQTFLGQDADVADIVEGVVESGMTFLSPEDVVSTAVMLVTPPSKRRPPDIHFAAIAGGLLSPVALITLAADQCQPGDLVIVRMCLATGTTYRRQVVFPFSMEEAVEATAPPTLDQALVQEDQDSHEETRVSRRLRAFAWLAAGASLASAGFWLFT